MSKKEPEEERPRRPRGNGSIFPITVGGMVVGYKGYLHDAEGRRRYRRGQTPEEVQQRLVFLATELEREAQMTSGDTLGAFAARWINRIIKPQVRQTTWERNQSALRTSVLPTLGIGRSDPSRTTT